MPGDVERLGVVVASRDLEGALVGPGAFASDPGDLEGLLLCARGLLFDLPWRLATVDSPTAVALTAELLCLLA